MKKKATKRGGKRPGAGRPPKANKIEKQKVTIKFLNPDLIPALNTALPRMRDTYIERVITEAAINDGHYKQE